MTSSFSNSRGGAFAPPPCPPPADAHELRGLCAQLGTCYWSSYITDQLNYYDVIRFIIKFWQDWLKCSVGEQGFYVMCASFYSAVTLLSMNRESLMISDNSHALRLRKAFCREWITRHSQLWSLMLHSLLNTIQPLQCSQRVLFRCFPTIDSHSCSRFQSSRVRRM